MLEKIDFEVADLDKQEYKQLYEELIDRLVVLQQNARQRGIGVVVLFEGWDGAGKGSRISDLIYELDARATHVHVTGNYETDNVRMFREEHLGATDFYPMMQEFWQGLGERGDFSFYERGWYTKSVQRLLFALQDAESGKGKHKHLEEHLATHFDSHLQSITSFESQLSADGYLVIKFFVHIRKETQRERLENLAGNKKTSWRVSPEELAHLDDYDLIYNLYDNFLSQSNSADAPWIILNGEDKRRSNLTIARTLVEALEGALASQGNAEEEAAEQAALKNSTEGVSEDIGDERTRTPEQNEELLRAATQIAEEQHSHAPEKSRFDIVPDYPTLQGVDHHLFLEREEYKTRLKQEQKRLAKLQVQAFLKRIPIMLCFEGWDAAGKGGAIKRVAKALDARSYTIFPSPAPSKAELAHPHLWRYWTRLPKAGHVGIYDRTWYGRVLVERIEGFASPQQWSRAYDEINEFEADMERWGAILLKLWVEVSPEEQLARFEERENNPEKNWKIMPDDWRNRDKFPQYRSAIEDMFRLTSTEYAPWIILESDNKYYARVKALRLINDAIEERLKD
ncbi:MAG: hypothetical protein LUD25_02715 [Coriobacteriaceae bacterium]|nr:hypothetical protein [Coriobacteriaceae bacterium]